MCGRAREDWSETELEFLILWVEKTLIFVFTDERICNLNNKWIDKMHWLNEKISIEYQSKDKFFQTFELEFLFCSKLDSIKN